MHSTSSRESVTGMKMDVVANWTRTNHICFEITVLPGLKIETCYCYYYKKNINE